MDVSEIRRLTPGAQNCIYYLTSGFSPKLGPVIDEVVALTRYHNENPVMTGVGDKMRDLVEQSRERVARAINADPSEIMLNENTSIGINVVASGIDWEAGDNVIISTHEHPANRIPWYNYARRYGIEVRYLEATEDYPRLLEQLGGLLDGRTRLVSVSHVSNRTGVRLPAHGIVQVAHARGVPVLFDGAQSFGAIPVDVKALDCDFYSFSGHKYIMAPQGTGGFYCRKDRIEWLKASWVGSHSQKEMDDWGHLVFLDEAKRFEFATRNLADPAGFGKALEIWEAVGWGNVFARIAAYTDHMKAALRQVPGLVIETPLPYERSSGIVSVHIPGLDGAKLAASLRDHERIFTSQGGVDNGIRISTHVFNTDEEIEHLVRGLLRVVKSGY